MLLPSKIEEDILKLRSSVSNLDCFIEFLKALYQVEPLVRALDFSETDDIGAVYYAVRDCLDQKEKRNIRYVFDSKNIRLYKIKYLPEYSRLLFHVELWWFMFIRYQYPDAYGYFLHRYVNSHFNSLYARDEDFYIESEFFHFFHCIQQIESDRVSNRYSNYDEKNIPVKLFKAMENIFSLDEPMVFVKWENNYESADTDIFADNSYAIHSISDSICNLNSHYSETCVQFANEGIGNMIFPSDAALFVEYNFGLDGQIISKENNRHDIKHFARFHDNFYKWTDIIKEYGEQAREYARGHDILGKRSAKSS